MARRRKWLTASNSRKRAPSDSGAGSSAGSGRARAARAAAARDRAAPGAELRSQRLGLGRADVGAAAPAPTASTPARRPPPSSGRPAPARRAPARGPSAPRRAGSCRCRARRPAARRAPRPASASSSAPSSCGQLALAPDEHAPRGAARRVRRGRGASSAGSWARTACSSSRSSRVRLDPELADQRTTRVPVGLKRLGLAPGTVEREHQLRREAARAADARRPALSSSPTTSAWRPSVEVHLDPVLERGQAQLLEAGDLRLGERLVGEVRERWPRQSESASCSFVRAAAASPAAGAPRPRRGDPRSATGPARRARRAAGTRAGA